MRPAAPAQAGLAHQPSDLIERLEAHRDFHFRRLHSRRVTGEKSALQFIEETGFCTGFTAGLGLPCLREAIAGEREPALPEHIQHDYAIGMAWGLKDSLPRKKLVYYGKALAGRPGFISLELLPAFLRLRAPRHNHRQLYARGELSQCAKLVMDALVRRGAAETMALKLASGYNAPKKRALFDRAMKELQEKFFALKIEERYEPFSYVWDTLAHRWADALRESRQLTPADAAYRIVARYFEIAGYGNERSAGRILGVPAELVESAMRRLARQQRVRRGLRLRGVNGPISILAPLVS